MLSKQRIPEKNNEYSQEGAKEVNLLWRTPEYETGRQVREVIDDRGLGLDKQLRRSHYLKKSKKGRKFPPRTVSLWFEEGVMAGFRQAAAAKRVEDVQ